MNILFVIIFGLIFGSFIGSTVVRLSNNQSLFSVRSKCPYCGSLIRWNENIPLFSYLLLKATSSCCNKKIYYFYPIIETTTLIIFLLNFILFDATNFLIMNFLSIFLLIILFTDLFFFLIFDIVIIILFSLSIYVLLLTEFNPFDTNIISSSIAFFSSISIFYLIKLIFLKLRGIDGLGVGDIKLIGVLSIITGLLYLPFLIIIASLLAILHLMIVKLMDHKNHIIKIKAPFGTYLVISLFLLIYSNFLKNYFLGG